MDIVKEIGETISNYPETHEKEISYKRGLNTTSFGNLARTLIKYTKSSPKKTTQLDILYNSKKVNNVTYRTIVHNKDSINNLIKKYNHFSASDMLSDILTKKDKNITFECKTRKEKIDYDDFRLRVSLEEKMGGKDTKDIYNNISKEDNSSILFRLKNRIELKYHNLLIHLTCSKQFNILSDIEKNNNSYELEVEIYKNDVKNLTKIMDLIRKTHLSTDFLISPTKDSDYKKQYCDMIFNKAVRLPKTLEKTPVAILDKKAALTYITSMSYGVSIKLDGERKFMMFSSDGTCLTIDNQMNFRIFSDKKYKNIANTILDGEYIYINNKLVFIAFDLLIL